MFSDLAADLRYRLRAVFRRGRLEQELDDELRFHLEREAEEHMRHGITRAEAERRARAAFGRLDDAKDGSREVRGVSAVTRGLNLLQALRHAARRVRRSPSFGLTAILTLALGIGATSAVFSVVDGVLLRPLPFPASGELVDIGHTLQLTSVLRVEQSDASVLFYRKENTALAGLGAYQPKTVNAGGLLTGNAGTTDRASAALVTASLFQVLQAGALHGRVITEADDQPGAAPVVVLSEPFWRRKFGGNPSVIGATMPVDGVPHLIVGILPRRFRYPDAAVELWLPSGIDPARTESATFGFYGVARLKPGATVTSAESDLNRLLPLLPEAFPGRLTAAAIRATKMRVVVRPLRDAVIGDVGRVLWIAFGAIGFVLLAACGNLANLFLVRAEARSREVALRRALGAGRAASLAESVSETVILASAGGVLGVLIAIGAVAAFQAFSARGGWGELPRLAEVHVGGMSVAFAAGVTIFTALLVSVVPLWKSRRLSPASLVGTERSATAGRDRQPVRSALVVSQVALALILLAGAGLMARSFTRLRTVPPGFDPAGVMTLRIALPETGYPTAAAVTRFELTALDRFASLPGVLAAGAATKLPLAAAGKADTGVWIEDKPLGMGKIPDLHQVVAVSPGYFNAVKIPLLEGRAFAQVEPDRPRLEAIVSRAFAQHYWPGESAVGKRIRTAPTTPWSEVIGVTGDVHDVALEQPVTELVYVPLVAVVGMNARSYAPREVAFVVRASGDDPGRLAEPVRRVVQELDPSVAVHAVTPMPAIVRAARARTAATLLLLGASSVAALALAGVGIFGVIAYGVSLRRREIGVRLALGATPAAVRSMVARRAVLMAGAGVAVGLVGAVGLTRVLAALLFETQPLDPPILGVTALVLLGVSFVAGWVPASRASRVDPASVLRAEQ